MIEGSQIDWAGHDHKSNELLDEMNDFSSAVKEALDFAKADGNTLVVVTSDHETGGMSITKGCKDAKDLELCYTTEVTRLHLLEFLPLVLVKNYLAEL